jgi:hypothetical protein
MSDNPFDVGVKNKLEESTDTSNPFDVGVKKKDESTLSSGENLGSGNGLSSTENQPTLASQSELRPVQIGAVVIKDRNDYNKLLLKSNKNKDENLAVNAYAINVSKEKIKSLGMTNEELKHYSATPKPLSQFITDNKLNTKDLHLPDNYNQNKILSPEEQLDLYRKAEFSKEVVDRNSEYTLTPEKSYIGGTLKGLNRSTEQVLRDIDGGLRLATHLMLSTVAPPEYVKSMDKSTTPFSRMADYVHNHYVNVDGLGDMPEGLAGDVINSITSLPWFFAGMAATPELKLEQIGLATKGIITKIPNIVSYMSVSNAAREYEKQALQGTGDKIAPAIEAAGEGATEGVMYHLMGFGSSKFGEYVGKATDSKIANFFTNVASNAGLFSGAGVVENVIKGEDIDKKVAVSNAVLGGGLAALGFKNFFTSDAKDIKESYNNTPPIEDLRVKQTEIYDQIEKEIDPKKKKELEVQFGVINQMANLKYAVNEVVKDPTVSLKSIENDPNLSEQEKKYYTDKVNSVVAETDPNLVKIKPFTDQLDVLNDKTKAITDNDSLNPLLKKKYIESIDLERDNINKQIEEVLGKKEDVSTVEKIPEEIIKGETKPISDELIPKINELKEIHNEAKTFDEFLGKSNLPENEKVFINEAVSKKYGKEISEEDLNKYLKDKEKEGDCPEIAKHGLKTDFKSGGKWSVVEDLEGEPSHKEGGVDIEVKGKDVNAEKDELHIRNEVGTEAIIPKKNRYEVLGMIHDNCHECLDIFVQTLPKMGKEAGNGGIVPAGTTSTPDPLQAMREAAKIVYPEYQYEGKRVYPLEGTTDIVNRPDAFLIGTGSHGRLIYGTYSDPSTDMKLKDAYDRVAKATAFTNKETGLTDLAFNDDILKTLLR